MKPSHSTMRQALSDATAILQRSGIESAALDARLLMGHVLEREASILLLEQDKILNEKQLNDFNALISRRSHHEPVAYITGRKEFWSLDFYVTRDTLIPRPDSETLIEKALKHVKNRGPSQVETRGGRKVRAKPITLLDIGTGTGCLLIALLKELPHADGTGSDNSEPALRVAKINAKHNKVDSRARFVHSHWFDAIEGTFDLIVSNPPYIAEDAMASLMPDIRDYEPRSALAAGDGLEAYRELALHIPSRLNDEGMVLLEVGEGQAKEVEKLLEAQGLMIELAGKDLSGIERCVVARKGRLSDDPIIG